MLALAGGWLWRQPLVHFLLLGALLFGLYGVVQGAVVPSTVAPTVTLDSPEQLAHGLGASFAEQVAAVTQLGW